MSVILIIENTVYSSSNIWLALLFCQQFLEDYIALHPIPAQTKSILDRYFLMRCKDQLSKEMLQAATRHVKENFETRITEYIAWELDARLWLERETTEDFKAKIESLAKQIFKAATKDSDETMLFTFTEYLEKEQYEELWQNASWDLLQEYRERLDVFNEAIPPSAKTRKGVRKTERGKYLYNLQKYPTRALQILHSIRSIATEDGLTTADSRERRSDIWTLISLMRPQLKSAYTRSDMVAANDILPEDVEAFEESDSPLTAEEISRYRHIKIRVQKERTQLWKEFREPGTEMTPRGFTLLPVCPLGPSMIRLDADSLMAIIKIVSKQKKYTNLPKGIKRTDR